MMTISSTLGWFSRIVNLTIELDGPAVADDGEEFIIPWDSFTGKVNVVDIKGTVSGRVKIVVMDGLRVWHSGMVLNVEQYLHYLDPFVSSDLCAREMRIVIDADNGGAGCWLEGTVYVNFSIPLDRNCCDADCYAAYTSHAMNTDGANSPPRDPIGILGQSGVERSVAGAAAVHSSSFTVKDTILSPSTSGKPKISNNNNNISRDYSSSSSKSNRSSSPFLPAASSSSGAYSSNPNNSNNSNNNDNNNNNSSSSSSKSNNISSTPDTPAVRDVCRWIPTYVGEAFGLRHSIMATLCRPWYAHSPELCIPLKLFSTVQDTAVSSPRGIENEEDDDDNYDNPKPLHLSVVDFAGLCVLSIPSQWADLDKPITAKVEMRDYTVPVVSMHLLMLRTEYIHDAHKDTIIFAHRVFGNTPQELLDAFPDDTLHSSGYVAREDFDDPNRIVPPGYEIVRNNNRGGDDPVCSGDGPCATFLFDFPMGNDPHSLNKKMDAPGSGSLIMEPYTSGRSTSSTLSGSSSSSSPRPGSSSPKRDGAEAPSYRERVQRQKEIEQEVEKRRSRLYASFESCQQEGDPFALHVGTDSDDDSEEEEEEGDAERGTDVSSIELSGLSLSDPEGGGGRKKAAGGPPLGSTVDDEDEYELAAMHMRRLHKQNQKEARKAEQKKKRSSKPYFDFLGDSVSVRYYLRLVVEDGEGDCKWNTSELVLFRSRAPDNSTNMSITEYNGSDTHSYEMTAV